MYIRNAYCEPQNGVGSTFVDTYEKGVGIGYQEILISNEFLAGSNSQSRKEGGLLRF